MRILISIWLIAAVFASLLYGGEDEVILEKNLWYHANTLTDRLKGEKWKFKIVRDELKRVQNAAEDLRLIQTYPANLIKVSEKDQSKIIKSIDKIIKRSNKLSVKIDDLDNPLQDAISITYEMFNEEPNLDMIEVLTQDNISRIQKLVGLKKSTDKLWDDVSSILNKYEDILGIQREKKDTTLFDDSFFKVLVSQIGRASVDFYIKFHDYKDSVAARGKERDWRTMAGADLQNISNRFGKSDLVALQGNLDRLSQRYYGKIPIGAINYYLGQSYLLGDNFVKSLSAFSKVKSDSKFYSESVMGVLQALFALGKDDSLIVYYNENINSPLISEPHKSSAKFLLIQSQYALGKDSEIDRTMLTFKARTPTYYKCLFIYAQSLVRQKRDKEASELFKLIISQNQLPLEQRRQASLYLAHLKYEQQYYQSAFADYKKLLDKPGYQAEALYGMVWCYVKMRDITAAEFTLKRLIGQFPDSPVAIESMLLLSKWRFIKANKLWDYKLNTDRNKKKLRLYRDELDKKYTSGNITDDIMEDVERKLSIINLTLSSRAKITAGQIGELYQEARLLSNYVVEHYRYGEFSSMEFSGVREITLEKLKNLLNSKSQKIKVTIPPDILEKKIFESRKLALDIALRYQNWLREYDEYIADEDSITWNKPQAGPMDSTTKLSSELKLQISVNEKILNESHTILGIIDTLYQSSLAEEIKDRLLFYKGLVLFEIEEDKLTMKMARHEYIGGLSPGFQAFTELGLKQYDKNDFEYYWLRLLNEFSDSKYISNVLYYLGYSQSLNFASKRGIRLLERMLADYPEHPYGQQALIVIGEFYFNSGELEQAKYYYKKVMENPDSKYFEQALYHLAWCHYSAGDYPLAISGFSHILENEITSKADYNSPLLKEALKMLAKSFAELDTLADETNKEIYSFIKAFKDSTLGAQVLHHVALVFRDQGRIGKSKNILNALIEHYSNFGDLPSVMNDIAIANDIIINFKEAVRIREEIFERFNRESQWYKSRKDIQTKLKADSLCEVSLMKIAQHYFAEASLNKGGSGSFVSGDSIYNRDAFMKAITAYERFLAIYPDNKNSGKLNYQLAESFFAIKDYYKATQRYLMAAESFDENIKIPASFNAIVAARKQLEILSNDFD